MINKIKLHRLYDEFLKTDLILTKKLNDLGFNSKELNELIKIGIIKRIKKGVYTLNSFDDLFDYGNKLLEQFEYEKADLCFQKCFQFNSDNLNISLKFLLRNIQKKDYNKVLKILENLYSYDESNKNDINYYLYLLRSIVNFPDKYNNYIKSLKFEDIKCLQNNDEADIKNKIRFAVFQGKIDYASKHLNGYIFRTKNITTQNIIEKELLSQIIDIEKSNKKFILNLINAKNYEELIKYLLDKKDKSHLNKKEEYTLKLSQVFVEMQTSLSIPNKIIGNEIDIYEAIENNNYENALKLSVEYNKQNKISNRTNFITIILNDICDFINNLSNKSQIEFAIYNIRLLLKQKNLDGTFLALKEYLNLINKSEFELLIVKLIKINLLEGDFSFEKPLNIIKSLAKENYSFDIYQYIQEFYICLIEKKFDEAEIYLNIISKMDNYKDNKLILDLLKVLHLLEEKLEYRTDDIVEKLKK